MVRHAVFETVTRLSKCCSIYNKLRGLRSLSIVNIDVNTFSLTHLVLIIISHKTVIASIAVIACILPRPILCVNF